MVEEQKQKHYAHERHMANTKTEQGKGKSQRKCQKNFTTTRNIKFHKNTLTGSQNMAGRQTG